ncbi:TIGR02234 family membrane protein [Corynebacterium sp. TAE3-ERU12]|nr:TIGR02234 family membrane protein [Corynebacterium sp. TAE3-ERU12]
MALGLIALSAAVMWLAGRASWLTVTTFDDKSGGETHEIAGAYWAAVITPLVLTLLAGAAAALILGGLGRRVVGVFAAGVAAAAAWQPLELLTRGADSDRALTLLQTGQATQRANDPITVSDWAVVQTTEVHNLGPIALIVGAALGVIGGVLLAMRPGAAASRRSSAYETPEVRRERAQEDLDDDPNSGRALWDALDAGVDPTDTNP